MSFRVALFSEQDLWKAVWRLVQEDLAIFRRTGPRNPFNSRVRYQREAAGQNVFLDADDAEREGDADCEDLSAWAIAWWQTQGIQAKPLLLPQRGRLFHVSTLACLDHRRWIEVDISRLKGM